MSALVSLLSTTARTLASAVQLSGKANKTSDQTSFLDLHSSLGQIDST